MFPQEELAITTLHYTTLLSTRGILGGHLLGDRRPLSAIDAHRLTRGPGNGTPINTHQEQQSQHANQLLILLLLLP